MYNIGSCSKCGDTIIGVPHCMRMECLGFVVYGQRLLPEGGWFLDVEGHKYPMAGQPRAELLNATAATKRAFIATLRLAVKIPRVFWSVKRILVAVKDWIEDIYEADYAKYQLPINYFSKSQREVIKTLTILYGEQKWIYCIAMILEIDLAYRYRFQDIVSELDKWNLIKDPRKEITRLTDIALEREGGGRTDSGVIAKVAMVRRLLKIALWISPMITCELAKILGDLNIDEIRFTTADRYWVANRFDYNYEGKTYMERMDWREAEERDWERPIIPMPESRPNIQINPNEFFYALSYKDATEMAEQARKAIVQDYTKRQKV